MLKPIYKLIFHTIYLYYFNLIKKTLTIIIRETERGIVIRETEPHEQPEQSAKKETPKREED